MSALLMAAQEGDPNCIELLLRAGAKVDITDKDGMTPIMLAAQRGRIWGLIQLLNAGANVEIRDNVRIRIICFKIIFFLLYLL